MLTQRTAKVDAVDVCPTWGRLPAVAAVRAAVAVGGQPVCRVLVRMVAQLIDPDAWAVDGWAATGFSDSGVPVRSGKAKLISPG